MNYRYAYVLCICPVLFSGCFSKKIDTNPSSMQLSRLGVTLQIPENFQPLPQDRFKDVEVPRTTIIEAEPFTVIPLYAYAEISGKGIMIISELKFNEGFTPEKYPMNNIFLYKKNLEKYFKVEEITSEEIYGKDITTVLLAIMFEEEEEEDFSLFKGLCYYYPERFFMIDLYLLNSKITPDDAFRLQNIFSSLGIY